MNEKIEIFGEQIRSPMKDVRERLSGEKKFWNANKEIKSIHLREQTSGFCFFEDSRTILGYRETFDKPSTIFLEDCTITGNCSIYWFFFRIEILSSMID